MWMSCLMKWRIRFDIFMEFTYAHNGYILMMDDNIAIKKHYIAHCKALWELAVRKESRQV